MGEQADYLIDQMIWGSEDFEDAFDYYRDYTPRRIRTATDVAEERLADVTSSKNVQNLNKGVIKW